MKNLVAFKFTIAAFAILSAISMSTVGLSAAETNDDGIVAIAFTGEGYTGLSWKIEAVGAYDLRKGFDLPNDSINSIKVRPGYKLMLFEHAQFEGERLPLESDTPLLPEAWKRQASSLIVEADPDYIENWLESAEDTEEYTPYLKTALSRDEMERATKGYQNTITTLMDWSCKNWFRELNDSGRIEKARDLLGFFAACGFNVSDWTPNSLAQQINNYCDWRPTANLFHTAIMILGINPTGPE